MIDRDPILDALRVADPLRDRLPDPGRDRADADAAWERILAESAEVSEPLFPAARLRLEPAIELSVNDGLATLCFDDGQANVLNEEILCAFEQAVDLCEAEPSIGALILVGRPGYFCAGLDRARVFGPREVATAHFAAVARCTARIFAAEIPVVAACTGHAIAAGAFLLLAADARVGARGLFRLGFNEAAIGLTFPSWGTELAAARLAAGQLTAATRGARLYAPDAAVEAGLLDEVVNAADLERIARRRATELAREGREGYAQRREAEYGRLIERMERRWRADFVLAV